MADGPADRLTYKETVTVCQAPGKSEAKSLVSLNIQPCFRELLPVVRGSGELPTVPADIAG